MQEEREAAIFDQILRSVETTLPFFGREIPAMRSAQSAMSRPQQPDMRAEIDRVARECRRFIR